MKATIIITCAIFFSTIVSAQTNQKATIRIKSVENINGKETVKDTVFTTEDVSVIKSHSDNMNISEIKNPDGTVKKVIVIKERSTSDRCDEVAIDIVKREADIEKLLKEMDLKDLGDEKKQVMIIKSSDDNHKDITTKLSKLSGASTVTIYITDAKSEDKLKLKEQVTANQLKVEHLDFFPNPNNGKFELSFSLPNTGEAKISVIASDGKVIYSKKLGNFTGDYKTEIDISENSKGVYFVKLEQNEESILKKIVLE